MRRNYLPEGTYLAAYMTNMMVLMARSSHTRGAISCGRTSVPDCIIIRHLESRAVCRRGHTGLRTCKDREFLKVVARKYFGR